MRARSSRGRACLLFVGTLADRTNVPFLVRAYDSSGVEAELVLAGRRARGHDELLAAIRDARSGARIRVVEDASDEALDGLYRSALALLHPSRYEGFGFTPLEAMTRGCPVLTSDIPPLREISGDGALVLPLDDESAWADAIRRVVGDEAIRADVKNARAAVPASHGGQVLAAAHDRLVAGPFDDESLVREEALVAAERERADVRVVVPDPALGVGRRGKDSSVPRQDSAGLWHDGDRISHLLEDVLQDDALERLVVERKRVDLDVTLNHVPLERDRPLDRGRVALDTRVVGEMVGEPGRAAPDVQEPRLRREVPSEIAPVPWLAMPV